MEEYVVHINNLQHLLRKGIILKKIRRAITFKQTAVLRNYALKNARLRVGAINELYKLLHKLANNAIYGKCIQNSQNYLTCKFVTSRKQAQKYLGIGTCKAMKRCVLGVLCFFIFFSYYFS